MSKRVRVETAIERAYAKGRMDGAMSCAIERAIRDSGKSLFDLADKLGWSLAALGSAIDRPGSLHLNELGELLYHCGLEVTMLTARSTRPTWPIRPRRDPSSTQPGGAASS